ncbi:SHC-transforming protein 3 [Nymphon striatum]|nr:SHC-transforming protein 3 [Nymphon striatum]
MYVGCLEVTTSMKSLDFDTRSQIAKECINKVCESGGLKTVDKKRKVDKRILRMLGDKPNMEFAGSNVNLTITSRSLNLTIMETGELIAEHEMPNVSFASGGDPDTLDFVAYVAKDHMYGRACFVLECGGGLAQDVITTVGQAFELRFKQYLTRAPPMTSDDSLSRLTAGATFGPVTTTQPPLNDDPEYYNDLPGKMPPDLPPEPPAGTKTLAKSEISNSENFATKNVIKTEPVEAINQCVKLNPSDKKALNEKLLKGNSADNLIDLNEELVMPSKKHEPEYANCSVIAKNRSQLANESAGSSSRPDSSDPFDLQPFEGTLPSSNLLKPLSPLRNNNTSSNNALSTGTAFFPDKNSSDKNFFDQKQALLKEKWFHGPISRKESETLVVTDGDFLVRESQGSPGQYVLTGMQGGITKHLLLVDPEGVVRTKDRTFESVSHLINYHSKNGLPIIAADSALVLSNPIKMRT